jgi:hypothetical protein
MHLKVNKFVYLPSSKSNNRHFIAIPKGDMVSVRHFKSIREYIMFTRLDKGKQEFPKRTDKFMYPCSEILCKEKEQSHSRKKKKTNK